MLSPTILSVILFANSQLLLVLAILMWQRRKQKGGLFFAFFIIASTIWAFAAALESAVTTLDLKIFWSQVSYLGIVQVGPLWLLFCLRFANIEQKSINKYLPSLWIVPLTILAFAFTNSSHHLLWTGYTHVKTLFGPSYNYLHGPIYYLNAVYSYSLLLAGAVLMIRAAIKTKRQERAQAAMLTGSILIPWIANILYGFIGSKYLGGVDITPVTFTITIAIIFWSLYRFSFLTPITTAKELIYKKLDNGIVITSSQGLVLEFNPFAKSILGSELEPGSSLVGLLRKLPKLQESAFNLSAHAQTVFLPDQKIWVEILKNNFTDPSQNITGHIYYIKNITDQIRIQETLTESQRHMANIIDFLPDPTFVIDNEERVTIWNKAIEQLTKIPAAKMIGKQNYEYSVPLYGEKRPILINIALGKSSPSRTRSLYKDITKTGDTYTIIRQNTRLDPKGVFLWSLAKPLKNSKGEVIGAIESIRNITDKQKAEEAMAAKVKELSSLNDLLINRELKMIELKERIKELEAKVPSAPKT